MCCCWGPDSDDVSSASVGGGCSGSQVPSPAIGACTRRVKRTQTQSAARHEEPIHPQEPRRARLIARRAPPAQPLETPLSPPSPRLISWIRFCRAETCCVGTGDGGPDARPSPNSIPPHALLPFPPCSLLLPVSGSRQGQWCRGEQVRAASAGGRTSEPATRQILICMTKT
jgi:hypothetical protein